MAGFTELLRHNRNYRYTWIGQVVSEVGDHFNNIAVFSLVMENTHSGMVVTGVMLSRAVSVLLGGPLAGVLLDRMDRKRIMIGSDLVRTVIGLCFLFAIRPEATNFLYLLSGLLMFASPFFTSGRSAILPSIASEEELHTANTLTQTTQWTTLALGGFLAGFSVKSFGYHWAFLLNSASFLFSAFCIAKLKVPKGFSTERSAITEAEIMQPWREYREGLAYMWSVPLLIGLAMINVGWASGGGAAQILFGLFGENVFHLGAIGIGMIWGCAGVGLVAGAAIAYRIGPALSFSRYKKVVTVCYVVHGLAYVIFSQMEHFWAALLFIALSRSAIAVSSVLNTTQLLRLVKNQYRGRVFATMETLTWSVMMLSMMAAGAASEKYSPRLIGLWSGIVTASTAVGWWWADYTGRLPEPQRVGSETDIEVHGEPAI